MLIVVADSCFVRLRSHANSDLALGLKVVKAASVKRIDQNVLIIVCQTNTT